MHTSPFSSLPLASRDPILGLNEAFAAETRTHKVNLGVGVYYDERGRIPLLPSVHAAETALAEAAAPRSYLPIEGTTAYRSAVQSLLFGADSPLIPAQRIATVQTLGGTGALRVGADLIKRFMPEATVALSDPSWENHRAIFESAGIGVNTYPYYDAETRDLNFAGMLHALQALPAGSVVLLHACCHNPTGVDLSPEQWTQVIKICAQGQLIPFLDMAYQGFGDGIEADAVALRLLAQSDLPFLVANSFSKSFSLYGERVGALSIVTASADEAARVLSQQKRIIRTNYSNPPTHGAALVAAVLTTPSLRSRWEAELNAMRQRIQAMRTGLVERLAKQGAAQFGFVARQRGMFSYSGLTAPQVERLRDECAIYAVSTGRICLAALNADNLDQVARAIAQVIQA